MIITQLADTRWVRFIWVQSKKEKNDLTLQQLDHVLKHRVKSSMPVTKITMFHVTWINPVKSIVKYRTNILRITGSRRIRQQLLILIWHKEPDSAQNCVLLYQVISDYFWDQASEPMQIQLQLPCHILDPPNG